jgi:hypothetical protein
LLFSCQFHNGVLAGCLPLRVAVNHNTWLRLCLQERNLLSVAYKNVVGARRASWRVLSSIETKEKEKGDADKVTLIAHYRERVEKELERICNELLDVLEHFLLPEDKTAEGQVRCTVLHRRICTTSSSGILLKF